MSFAESKSDGGGIIMCVTKEEPVWPPHTASPNFLHVPITSVVFRDTQKEKNMDY